MKMRVWTVISCTVLGLALIGCGEEEESVGSLDDGAADVSADDKRMFCHYCYEWYTECMRDNPWEDCTGNYDTCIADYEADREAENLRAFCDQANCEWCQSEGLDCLYDWEGEEDPYDFCMGDMDSTFNVCLGEHMVTECEEPEWD